MTLRDIILELIELKEKAEYRANIIVEDGRKIPIELRAKSSGYASAYTFCIMRLCDYAVEHGEDIYPLTRNKT